MALSSSTATTMSAKRNRSKVSLSSEDESNSSKRLKPDCCRVNDIIGLNKSRIYNFGYRKKPAELFRKDLISAMKMADTEQLNREEYLPITDSWREEWEKGVQVAVNPDLLPEPMVRTLRECETSETPFKLPKKLIKSRPETEPIASKYELDLQDLCWLEAMAENDNMIQISDNQLEDVINQLEQMCAINIKAQQVGIEYDDHIVCDVCRSPDAEEGNEMVFCDFCNICVHQACYGITDIPEGDWLCRPCKEFGSQKKVSCVLCPNFGGALKSTSSANQWCHVSCALWVPEVSIGCVSTMEPITKIKQIPQTRWNLICSLCNVKHGAPIQCSVKTCKTAYHVICAFNHKLKMKAIVENDKTKGVKLKSYCKKHTENGDIDDEGNVINIDTKGDSLSTPQKAQHEIEIATNIAEDEDKHENDFWKYIDINKVQQELIRTNPDNNWSKNVVFLDFIVQYWKLKRTSNYGASLIKLTSSAQFQEQLQHHRNEILRLRVDLERIRNLSYMICRREKVKRNWIKTHQNTVEKTITSFTGVSGKDDEVVPKIVEMSCENVKLVTDIVNNSVIYKYNENDNKNQTNSIVRQLRRLSKVDQLHRLKPNPYAKFYISHLKRKHDNKLDNNSDQTSRSTIEAKRTGSLAQKPIQSVQQINVLPKPVNGLINRNKNSDKQVNGFSTPKNHMKCNNLSTMNGIHNRNSSSSDMSSPECKPSMNYRQSSRSLLKPKHMISSNLINSSKEDKHFPSLVPVLTRTTLSGYKIPKKKQDSDSLTNQFKFAIDESIERFRRRLDQQLSNRSPNKNSNKFNSINQTNQLLESSQELNCCNINKSQTEQCIKRGKNNGIYNNSNKNHSLLRTRGQHSLDEDALMASAKNDIDMRRHQSSGFKQFLIH
ncbi:protein Jade-3-like [Oppia nitens]|uniref:protein Jade-3-like n=1 Tax=Oppia nitens TaxID=1686743 RepID=UPI0023DC696D|nr:protein Jade-3-like [Oppia nitens]